MADLGGTAILVQVQMVANVSQVAQDMGALTPCQGLDSVHSEKNLKVLGKRAM
jgi:hypothetical protein